MKRYHAIVEKLDGCTYSVKKKDEFVVVTLGYHDPEDSEFAQRRDVTFVVPRGQEPRLGEGFIVSIELCCPAPLALPVASEEGLTQT